MAKKQSTPLSESAITALRESVFTGNSFRLSAENLECYPEIKALVEALGGKWVSSAKEHRFAAGVEAEAMIRAACDRGEIPATNPLDFFPTPQDVIDEMVDGHFSDDWDVLKMAAQRDARPMRYLEPNGGTGALVAVMAAAMLPGDELVVVEKDPILASNLRSRFPAATVIEGDFLDFNSEQPFDVVMMNPPFAGKKYIQHVRHAFGMLRRFGILSSVIPTGFLIHDDSFVFEIATAGTWENLGKDRFAGAKVETSIIWIENSPENLWREKPHEGYSTGYAWNLSVAIHSDGDMQRLLRGCTDFVDASRALARYGSKLMADCQQPVRIDAGICSEVIRSLVGDYEIADLKHILPSAPVGQLELISAAA